jgi:hypothetical protein
MVKNQGQILMQNLVPLKYGAQSLNFLTFRQFFQFVKYILFRHIFDNT